MLQNELQLDKLVHGGQALAHDGSGKPVFVWGGLPGEVVRVTYTRRKSGWSEAIVEDVVKPVPERIQPLEPNVYLGTSPWQIMSYEAEQHWKDVILKEVFASEKIIPEWNSFAHPKERFGYRHKMEYNFWFDTETNKLSLALQARGTHRKIAVLDSVLASDSINEAGKKLISFLNAHSIGGRQLKSVIILSSNTGEVGVVLFCTDRHLAAIDFSSLEFGSFKLYYSNPKSPASVPTELLCAYGSDYLEDTVGSSTFRYSPEGFFQVNIAMYEDALSDMSRYCSPDESLVDMYAGVGSIGLSLPRKWLVSVELDAFSSKQAQDNAAGKSDVEIVLSESEKALEYINQDQILIVDPPRAGLHKKVVDRITETKPKTVIYLSCNPATQARDTRCLIDAGYRIDFARGYNFFPSTPHIESLLILRHD